MRLKEGVRLKGVRPEIIIAMILSADVLNVYDIELVITSVMDGKHMEGSKHYKGLAFDFRSRDIDEGDIVFVRMKLKEWLGSDYDVIYENDHFHVEYDPKS